MILFNPEHELPILAGVKTETRRLGRRRWRIGATHACFTRAPYAPRRAGVPAPRPFAFVAIRYVYLEPLGDVTNDAARREGYGNRREFLEAIRRIHGAPIPDDRAVWVVGFDLVFPTRYTPPVRPEELARMQRAART